MADVFEHGIRRRLTPALLAAALVAGGLMQGAGAAPKGPPSGPKNYLPSASPAVVPLPVAATATVQITLANCGACDGVRTSAQSFGSAQVRFATTAPLAVSGTTLSRSGWSVDLSYDTSAGLTVLELGNSGIGTTLAVQPGEAVTLTIPVAPTATATQIPFQTQVKQSNDFSGEGNDFLPAGADPVVYIGSGPARTLEFGRQPTTIQGTGQTAGTDTTAVLTTCASVRALDAYGNLATSFTGSVALAPSDTGLGLKLGGATPVAVSAVAGVATFGTGAGCSGGLSATKLGFGFTLTASSAGLTSVVSSAFDVLQFYALCSGSCATPALGSKGTTTASAQASSTTGETHPFTFDVGQRAWAFASLCNPDLGALGTNPFRSVVTVDLNGHSKTVTVLWSKQAVQWSINNGASQWRVCIATTYPFAAVDGPATPVGASEYVGALLPCGAAALGATDPCLHKLNKSGGQQQAIVSMPLRDGDPKII